MLAESTHPSHMAQSAKLLSLVEARSGTADSAIDDVRQSRKWPMAYASTKPDVSEMVLKRFGSTHSRYCFAVLFYQPTFQPVST